MIFSVWNSNGEQRLYFLCVTRFSIHFLFYHSRSFHSVVCVCVIFGTEKIFNLLQSAKSIFYSNHFFVDSTNRIINWSCCCFDAVNIQFSVAICCAVCVMMSQAWKISTTIKSRHGFPLFVWCCVNMSLSHSCQPSSSIKHLEVTRMNGKFTTNHYNKYETLTEQKNTFKYVFALFGYRMKLVDQLYKSNVRFVCDLSSSGKERKWTICKRFTINRQFLFDEHND